MLEEKSQKVTLGKPGRVSFFISKLIKKGEEMGTKAYWSVSPRKMIPGFEISLVAVEHCSPKRPHFYHEKLALVDPYTGYFDPIDPERIVRCAIFLVYLDRSFSRSALKYVVLDVERCLKRFLKKQGLTFNWVPGFKTVPNRNYYGFLGKLGFFTANHCRGPARGEILLFGDRILIINVFSTDLHAALIKYKKYIQEGVNVSLS